MERVLELAAIEASPDAITLKISAQDLLAIISNAPDLLTWCRQPGGEWRPCYRDIGGRWWFVSTATTIGEPVETLDDWITLPIAAQRTGTLRAL